jgi:hypothetical protein
MANFPCRVCWLDLKNTLWELNQISSFALQRGTEAVSKGAAFGPFSWFVLCRMTKNEHQNRHRSARTAGAQYDRQKKKL